MPRAALVGLVVLGVALSGWTRTAVPIAPLRLLVITHAAEYQHDVTRRPSPRELATAEQVVADLGRESGAFTAIHVQTSTELATLTPQAIRGYQAFLIFTTGSLPLSVEARQALFARVREGAGFIGVHSAADTWHDVPEYGELLGGTFDGHPWHQRVRIVVEHPNHSATAHLGQDFWVTDEIYQFRNWARGNLQVLLRLDAGSVDVRLGRRNDHDYALAWIRSHGTGRVFYTALGHRPEVWADVRFRRHLLGGIRWVLDR